MKLEIIFYVATIINLSYGMAIPNAKREALNLKPSSISKNLLTIKQHLQWPGGLLVTQCGLEDFRLTLSIISELGKFQVFNLAVG